MKKHSFVKNILLAVLLAALLAALLTVTSCKTETPPDPEDTTAVPLDTLPSEPEPSGVVICQDKKTEYRIVRAANGAGTQVLNKANDLADAINKYMLLGSGKYLFADRDNSDVTEYEILVGKTNRPESAEVLDSLAANDYAVRLVGKKLVIIGKTDADTTNAVKWFIDNFITDHDALILEEEFSYIRSKAPYIVDLSQEDYYWNLTNSSPEITIKVFCSGATAPELVRLTVDGRDISSKVACDGGFLTMSGILYENGMHTARIVMKAPDGSLGYEQFHFGTGECEDMKLYKGEVHAHTEDSDGIGTPDDAYKYARDVAGLDFFAVTDHSNSYSEANYKADHIPTADKYNEPGKFAALYGYEETYSYTSGYYGHLNTLNTPVYALRAEGLKLYYTKMSKAAGAIVQFNHPGYSWGNFLEYDMYSEQFDKVVNLFEFKGSGYDNEWALCLAKGWHVSPMHNEDNHSGQWGTVNEAVGYVLAPSLTRQNITEAMTMNRSYTTTDQSMKIYFKINDTWMGGRLNAPEELKVSVKITSSKVLGKVQIVAEDNIVVASNQVGNGHELDWELTLTPEYDYYYVKVNGTGFAVTAPVWVENRNKINISGMDRDLIVYENNSNKDHRVSVAFKAEEAMTDVTVKFYQSALSGFDINEQKCVEEKKIGNMAAGAEATAFADVAYSAATPRITAVVTGKIDGKTYSDTYYIQLTPLLFTEISASANGYSFIELYNATTEPINLSKYKIRYWPKTGAKSDALAEKTISMSGTIQPHSVMVVWLQTKTNLTLANFNSKYKSSLTENKDVVVLKSTWDAPISNSTQIEILDGSNVISRAQYNYGVNTADVAECKSVTFTYQTVYTLTAIKQKIKQTATPGTFDAALMPELINKAS